MKEPSIHETAFACPHCAAYTSQQWYATFSNPYEKTSPHFPSVEFVEAMTRDTDLDQRMREDMKRWAQRMWQREPFLEEDRKYCDQTVRNLSLSQCFACSKISVWVADRLVFPTKSIGPIPNADLPKDIASVFDEARRVIGESPKGAAALLRLCVQKLCIHLGEKGEKIDEDIKSLVVKGLNPTVRKSLDIVRVVGNEAVHPGTIDLNDDRETALALFDLVNAIADQMISHPKRVDSLYEKLPAGKRQAIEKRDKRS